VVLVVDAADALVAAGSPESGVSSPPQASSATEATPTRAAIRKELMAVRRYETATRFWSHPSPGCCVRAQVSGTEAATQSVSWLGS
jgi:hypothetical protein